MDEPQEYPYIRRSVLRRALKEASPRFNAMNRAEQSIVIEKIRRAAGFAVQDEIRLLER